MRLLFVHYLLTHSLLIFVPFTTPTQLLSFFFFFNDPATPEFSPLPLHDALPISIRPERKPRPVIADVTPIQRVTSNGSAESRPDFFHSHSATLPLCKSTLSQTARRSSRLHASRSEEHTSELQSQSNLVCRLLLEK